MDELILKDELKKMQGSYQQEVKRSMLIEYDLLYEKDILSAVTQYITKKYKAKVRMLHTKICMFNLQMYLNSFKILQNFKF